MQRKRLWFCFFSQLNPNRSFGLNGCQQEVDCQPQVVAQHVAQHPYGDAKNDDFLVVEKGCHQRDERRRVDECHRGDQGGVAVEFHQLGEQYLKDEGAEDDEQDIPKDVEASGEVHLPNVAAVGYGEAEGVDEVQPQGESGGRPPFLLVGAIDFPYQGDECGGNGQRGEYEDEHGGGQAFGEEGGEQVGDHCDDEGQQRGRGMAHQRVGLWQLGGIARLGLTYGLIVTEELAECGFAEADDKHEVEACDDEVVGGDIKIGLLVHADALCDGPHVRYAAGVDADGYGTYLRKLLGVAVSFEEKESCHAYNQHCREAAEEGFQDFAGRPMGEAARNEHQRDGERYADAAHQVV